MALWFTAPSDGGQNFVAFSQQVPSQVGTSLTVKLRHPRAAQVQTLMDPSVSKDHGRVRSLISSPSASTTFGLPKDTVATVSPVPPRPTTKCGPSESSEGQEGIQFMKSVMPRQSKSSDTKSNKASDFSSHINRHKWCSLFLKLLRNRKHKGAHCGLTVPTSKLLRSNEWKSETRQI